MERPWNDLYVDVSGVRTHYMEAGEGETLVLVHGGLVWCCAELTYGAVIEPLSRKLRVVAVDTIGYGMTQGRGPQDYAPSSQGDFLIEFIRRLGTRVHLAGNSHGGWLVQYIAHEAPELVRRVVIINSLNGTSPIPHSYALPWEPDASSSQEEIRRDLLAFYVNPAIVTPVRVERTHFYAVRNSDFAKSRRAAISSNPEAWNRSLTYRGHHISHYADRLKTPVLLTWSRENRGASPGDALEFFNRIDDVEMCVFANAGHHVMTEHPERWASVATDFLLSGR